MISAARICFGKYFTFSGRARRPEYWWFLLFVILGAIVFSVVDMALFGVSFAEDDENGPLTTLFQLLTFIPLLAAGWRRMHDTGRTGWLLLLPIGFAVAMALVAVLGIAVFAGFVTGETAGSDPATAALAAESALAAVVVQGVFGIVFLVLLALMIWWLSRPTEPTPNRFGDVPAQWGQ